jgi:hypothetical protein
MLYLTDSSGTYTQITSGNAVKWILKRLNVRAWTVFSSLRMGTGVAVCEHGK